MEIGKGFHQENAVCFGRGEHFLCLRFGNRQGFFAQDVLAGLQCTDRPGTVQVVREGNIDRLHVGISQQLLIASVCFPETECIPEGLRLFQAASGYRKQFAVFRLLHSGNCCSPRDIRCAENSPSDLYHIYDLHHMYIIFRTD